MNKSIKTLLVDADIVAFRCSARYETKTAFGKALGSLPDAKDDADLMISFWESELGASRSVMALSCRESNFRDGVLPTYKDNRDTGADARPAYLPDLKAYLSEKYETHLWYGLEGDDVLGILHTHPDRPYGDTIIISEDKDLRTVPGRLYAPHRPEVGLIDITPLEANQFLCWQTICGDSTDGYGGAKGVGKQSDYAQEVLQADADELWDIVLDAYASKGFSEEDALVQARCAKILTSQHYNQIKEEVVLWTPEDLMM